MAPLLVILQVIERWLQPMALAFDGIKMAEHDIEQPALLCLALPFGLGALEHIEEIGTDAGQDRLGPGDLAVMLIVLEQNLADMLSGINRLEEALESIGNPGRVLA